MVSTEALGDLEATVIRHQRLYLTCYGENAFTPKLHMLVLIVEQIKLHGPGHHHWTMRCEGKNALPKSKKLFNLKNVPLTVSEFFQIKLSYGMWHGDGNAKYGFLESSSEDTKGVPYSLTPAFVHAGLPECAVGFVGLSLTSCTCDNVLLRVDDVMMSTTVSGSIGFLKIVAIVSGVNRIFFLCNIMVPQCHDQCLNCYVLRETLHTTVVAEESFLIPWPLYIYRHEGHFRGVPRYYAQLP